MSLSVPFSLDQYISHYSGETVFDRLFFIISQNNDYKIEAIKLLINLLLQSKNIRRYNKLYETYANDIATLGEAYAFNENWVNTLDDQLKDDVSRFDNEITRLKSKSNTIDSKNDLRNAHLSLGQLYYEHGEFSLSLQSFNRIRDTTMDKHHILEMLKNMIKVSHLTRNTTNVSNCVDQALNLNIATPTEIYTLKCYDALALLWNQKYTRAVNKFLELDFNHIPDDLNTITQISDIATYVGLCSIAEFNRSDLRLKILQNPNFQLYLESNPDIESVLKNFYESRYGKCIEILEKIKPHLENDLFIQKSIEYLYDKIRKNSIINYFKPYEVIDLSLMAETFNVDIESLEKDLTKLILNGDIQAKIDSHNKKLIADKEDLRISTYLESMKLGETFHKNVRSMLIQANMKRHHFSISLEHPRRRLMSDYSMDVDLDMDIDPNFLV